MLTSVFDDERTCLSIDFDITGAVGVDGHRVLLTTGTRYAYFVIFIYQTHYESDHEFVNRYMFNSYVVYLISALGKLENINIEMKYVSRIVLLYVSLLGNFSSAADLRNWVQGPFPQAT